MSRFSKVALSVAMIFSLNVPTVFAAGEKSSWYSTLWSKVPCFSLVDAKEKASSLWQSTKNGLSQCASTISAPFASVYNWFTKDDARLWHTGTAAIVAGAGLYAYGSKCAQLSAAHDAAFKRDVFMAEKSAQDIAHARQQGYESGHKAGQKYEAEQASSMREAFWYSVMLGALHGIQVK
jgi:hypothetical protein